MAAPRAPNVSNSCGNPGCMHRRSAEMLALKCDRCYRRKVGLSLDFARMQWLCNPCYYAQTGERALGDPRIYE